MTIDVLTKNDYDLYLDHIKKNYKNTRTVDPNLINKISDRIYNDNNIVIFTKKNKNQEIINSILTLTRKNNFEYYIINYRTSGSNFFNKTSFLNLFDFMFDYYEGKKYYKWLLARPLNLLNKNFFANLGSQYPFSKYETAIEAFCDMENFNETIYNLELLSGIPDTLSKNKFFIISGFCKQKFRSFDKELNDAFI